jgi:hypothetical protein
MRQEGSGRAFSRALILINDHPMPPVDKHALVQMLRDEIARTIEVLSRAANEAREAATHEEAKPENDKDTRAVEAAYLAGAQAERARDLARADAALKALSLQRFAEGAPISASALIELDQDGVVAHYFLAPHGGGMKVSVNGLTVTVLTPQSALGRELLGRSRGDAFEVTIGGKLRSYEIVSVS